MTGLVPSPEDIQVNDPYPNIAAALYLLASGQDLRLGDPQPMVIDYNDDAHRYKIDGWPVPAVTTVLDETENKPALTWWGFRVGLAGAVRALSDSRMRSGALQAYAWEPIIKPALFPDHPEIVLNKKTGKPRHELEALMISMRHHPNAIKDDRGTVGTSIHVAADQLHLTGEVPDIGGFPQDDRGYVQALARYWMHEEPEVVHSEVIVGSRRFGFAGRFDNIVRKGAGLILRDYKTSGGVYPSFDTQLAAYDLGWLEMGNEELAGHEVVHLQPDGQYAVIPMHIDHADFLSALLRLHDVRRRAAAVKRLGRNA